MNLIFNLIIVMAYCLLIYMFLLFFMVILVALLPILFTMFIIAKITNFIKNKFKH